MARNPIALVRQGAKRERIPDVLDADELKKLLSELQQPYKTMVFLAATTGLRVSELLALTWQDINFAAGEITLRRAIVQQVVGEMKTESSQKPVPMEGTLAEAFWGWRAQSPYRHLPHISGLAKTQSTKQPYWPENLLRRHIRPAALRVGITKVVGWHSFRRTFATLLQGSGEDVKTTQELMRHASSKITLDVYAQALTPVKRAAQRKVAEMIQPTPAAAPS